MNYYIEMFVAKESHEGSSDGRFSQIFIGKLLDKVNRTTVFKTDSNGHLTAHQLLLEVTSRDHDYHRYRHFSISFCWLVSPQYTTRLCRRERSASNTSKWLISVSSGPERMWDGSLFCFHKNTQG